MNYPRSSLLFQGTRHLEEVCRAGDDQELLFEVELCGRLLVQSDDPWVVLADYEQGGRPDSRRCWYGKIGARYRRRSSRHGGVAFQVPA